uniref:RNA-binding protein 42 n=1 Tax=Ascaris lumbricoides TaxID=6252 RepID=A0A9J2PR25_ASCLU
MNQDDTRNIDEELALFEQEISTLEDLTTASTPESTPVPSMSNTSLSSDSQTLSDGSRGHSAPVVAGPMLPTQNGTPRIGLPPAPPNVPAAIRGIPPFLPHVMMRPGFLPPPNLAMRFLPPQVRITGYQLRLPLPPFLRPPIQPAPQPVVLESGPSLYEDAEKKSDDNEKEKESDAGPSTMKTQALSSDVELVAQKKHNEAANRSSYIGQVLRGEKKMKRFLRCGGGQVWEDSSLAEWDPNDFRIFCGDLGNEVSDELLAKAFRKYPSFQKAKVIRESRTNKSKGYGFVSFKHQDDFVRACREMDGKYVGNRPIKLRKSNWRERNMEVVRKKQKQKQRLGLA